MTDRHSTESEEDVIALLTRQHQELRALFRELDTATGAQRAETFRQLVRLLVVHETAEEEVVHPVARRAAGGAAIVDARVGEEVRAKKLLGTLTELGPDAEGFDSLLIQLREDVLAHSRHEEQEEFPRLRAQCDEEKLRRMAGVVRAAEAAAPTRPHLGPARPTGNVLVATPLALVERVRELLRRAMGH
ncbi:hemerythrin domain-containing protein [Goodfellowiella coeruleoviolacea]|uniref:Hemerythrin HHE cation binding domain-containing protein n=1 Tax=Goodfellowiella coeruleoviolacea TaxID=334858 RepID=A0AAE3KEP8_9PSEU|nr:hemerythrin domain-containing protein [Goodfellowiella coeruleoviolacea]MCP2164122.1 Hemerythrin HHE cation binding domain-containing protein [Goodfellowiella coeruleoviolacea]